MTRPAYYLISWPRSGSTLLRSLLWSGLGLQSASAYPREHDYLSDRGVGDAIGSVSIDAATDPKRCGDDVPLLIKIHSVRHAANHSAAPVKAAGAIYVVRDGMDAIVSYHRYLRDVRGCGDLTVSEVILGHVPFGSWSRHIVLWLLAEPSYPKTVVVSYDRMLREPEAVIAQLGRFLGRDLQSRPRPEFGDLHDRWPAFFRRGTSGDGAQQMTPAERRLFFAHHGGVQATLHRLTGDRPCRRRRSSG